MHLGLALSPIGTSLPSEEVFKTGNAANEARIPTDAGARHIPTRTANRRLNRTGASASGYSTRPSACDSELHTTPLAAVIANDQQAGAEGMAH